MDLEANQVGALQHLAKKLPHAGEVRQRALRILIRFSAEDFIAILRELVLQDLRLGGGLLSPQILQV